MAGELMNINTSLLFTFPIFKIEIFIELEGIPRKVVFAVMGNQCADNSSLRKLYVCPIPLKLKIYKIETPIRMAWAKGLKGI